jgi:hypothetical protein
MAVTQKLGKPRPNSTGKIIAVLKEEQAEIPGITSTADRCRQTRHHDG